MCVLPAVPALQVCQVVPSQLRLRRELEALQPRLLALRSSNPCVLPHSHKAWLGFTATVCSNLEVLGSCQHVVQLRSQCQVASRDAAALQKWAVRLQVVAECFKFLEQIALEFLLFATLCLQILDKGGEDLGAPANRVTSFAPYNMIWQWSKLCFKKSGLHVRDAVSFAQLGLRNLVLEVFHKLSRVSNPLVRLQILDGRD